MNYIFISGCVSDVFWSEFLLILYSESWQLVAEKEVCSGVKYTGKGELTSVEDCAEACTEVATMFAFGTNDYDLDMCDNTGNCPCYCYDGANDDGTCIQNHNNGFRLYRYEKNKNGKRFSLKLINYSQLSSILTILSMIKY